MNPVLDYMNDLIDRGPSQEDVRHDEAVQREVDMGMEMSDKAAYMLYKAAKVALARGNLDSITEFSLRTAVNEAEQF